MVKQRVLLPLLLMLMALPVSASTQYYYTGGPNSEALFNTNSGGLSYNTFLADAGLLPATFLLDAGPTGVDFYGFSNNNSGATNLALNGTRLEHTFMPGSATLRIEVPTNVTSIGLHLTATTLAGFAFEAAGATNAAYASLNLDPSTISFFGIISDSPITAFQIRKVSLGGVVAITNFGVGVASETPEPSSFALMGGALILFPLLARRRKQSR